MTSIRTVLGPVPPDRLGAVDAHEHLFLRSVALPGEEFGDLAPMTEEALAVKESGIDTVVELTPVGLGRDPGRLAALSEATGLHVIAATGFHRDAHYPPGHWVYREPDDVLLEVLLTDLRQGMDARDWQGPVPVLTPHRAGIVKLGASYQRITAAERRRLEVGAEAARRTGVPVAVHCEIGTAAPEILDLLDAAGVPPAQVLLAHLDRNPDPGHHAELAGRGAYLIYDTVGRIKYRPDSVLVDLIAAMLDAGHARHLLLGTDVGRRGMLRSYGGGPGMAVLARSFLPRLATRFGQATVDQLTRANPARALTPRDGE